MKSQHMHEAKHEAARGGRFDRRSVILLTVVALVAIVVIVMAFVLLGRASDRKTYENAYSAAMASYIDGNYDDALASLRKAQEIDDSEECAVLAAKCYFGRSGADSAVRYLEEWLSGHAGADAEALLGEYKSGVTEDTDSGDIEIAGQKASADTANLAIRDKSLTSGDMELIASLTKLTNLSLESCGISDLTPISGLTGLETLIISGNSVRDLSPLSGLTALRTLYINDNPVEDFTPLYDLRGLTTLNIKGIEITDTQLEELQKALPDCSVFSEEATVVAKEIKLGGVTFMSDVKELDLSGKGVTDISALTDCTELEVLNLKDNKITDLTPLMQLPKLRWLSIWKNSVTDLTPLMGLTSLEYLDAESNAVTRVTALSALTNLTELYLNGNTIKSISPILNLAGLTKLGLKDTGLKDSDVTALSVLKGLKELNLEDNEDITGDAVDALKLKLTGCTVTHSELVYKVILGKAEFRSTDVSADASGKSVSDISGASRFTAIKTLILNDNSVKDISALASKDTLEALELSGNGLADIGPLKGHGRLKVLNLIKNKITDLTPLSDCTALTELHLSYNADLKDITALAKCTALTELSLDYTSVTDLTPLSQLRYITYLGLEGCAISDATPLYSLTSLRELYISGSLLTEQQLAELRAALPKCAIYT